MMRAACQWSLSVIDGYSILPGLSGGYPGVINVRIPHGRMRFHLISCISIIGEAYLACGIADGSLMLIKVVQTLKRIESTSGFTRSYEIERSFEVQSTPVCENDGRGITALRWIEVEDRVSCLIRAIKPQAHGKMAYAYLGHPGLFQTGIHSLVD